MQPPFPLIATILFIVLSAALAGVIVSAVSRILKRKDLQHSSRQRITGLVAFLLFAWLAFLAVISFKNILNQWDAFPPRMMIVLLPPLALTIILLFSKKFGRFLQYVPAHWLILVQAFRIIVEVILWQMAVNGNIHHRLTFEGRNFDVLIGISALVVAHYASRNKLSKRFLTGWNIFGLAMLANIVVMAILSAPFPFRFFMDEPANIMIAYFPFVWLPGFLVPVAYSMHLFSLKQLLDKN